MLALYDLKCGKNANVIQLTGKKTTVCFQIPSLMEPQGDYIGVPKISLGEDHLHSFMMMNVKAVFLNANSFKQEYSKVFGLKTLDKDPPTVIILMPEILFGLYTIRDVVNKIDRERLIIYNQIKEMIGGNFARCKRKKKKIKTIFACLILLLSATLKPKP